MKSGVSVYIGLNDYSIEDNLKYLNQAKEAGFEYVFSSAHITEATLLKSDLKLIIDECFKLGLKLSLDISKPVMDKITIPPHLHALRLDYGFSEDDIVRLSNEASYYLELNASTIKIDKLKRLIEKGLNVERVRLSFNFYPKLYTAHDIETVYEKTKCFKKLGFSVGAFIPSHTGFRPPIYEGLPSVESHRKMKLDEAIEELKACDVDIIYFGDAYASIDELKTVKDHLCNEHLITLNLYNGAEIFDGQLDNVFIIRPDLNSLMLRVSSSRTSNKIETFNTINRKKYDVTIDNHLFKRYMGEINIILNELPNDERVNVIGYIETTDVVINSIKNGAKFKFKIKKKG